MKLVMHIRRLFVLLPALTLFAARSHAQCAEWDTRFSGSSGLNNGVNAMAVYDDGSGPALYAAGGFTSAGAVNVTGIARWNGSSWSAVGASLTAGYAAQMMALTVFDDGSGSKLYIGGQFPHQSVAYPILARWDGSSWSSFGGPGIGFTGPFPLIDALISFDDGSGPALYIGGVFPSSSGVSTTNIARWNGSTWSAIGGSGTNGRVRAFGVYDDGSGPALYVGGDFTSVSGVPALGVAKWNGSSWSALGLPGSGTDASVRCFSTFNDGSGSALFVGGDFATANGVSTPGFARWNGTSWSAVGGLGNGMNGPVYSASVLDDGSGPALFAGGNFNAVGSVSALCLAKWNGTSWSALGAPGAGPGGPVFALTQFNSGASASLVAGGSFNGVGALAAPNIARWNGTNWFALNGPANGMSDQVQALQRFDDGTGTALYAGGKFTTAGGVAVGHVAKWNGTNWSALGGVGNGVDGTVNALADFDDGGGAALYVTGSFANAGGSSAANIAKWNGTSWSALGNGLGGSGYALAAFDDGSGPALYAGGQFSFAGTASAANIAKWNGSSWSALSAGMSGNVLALTVFDDGSGPALYAGGTFTTAGFGSASRIAKWNGTSWSALASGVDAEVDALCVHDDGTGSALYVGGFFTNAGGIPSFHIARWKSAAWSALGLGTNGGVFALSSFDSGSGAALIAGGQFTTAGGNSDYDIAQWDGTNWSVLGGGVGSGVFALATFNDGHDGDLDLYAGGAFTQVVGASALFISSVYIAQWHGCGVSPFCFGDPSVNACPCANNGASGHGCNNSIANGGAVLSASGTTEPDTLVLFQQGELANALSIFLQGDLALGAPAVFGDGLRCVGGSLHRLYVKSASAGSVHAPQLGDPSISARSGALGDGLFSGSVRYYQAYYRDADPNFCPAPQGSTFNVGNALRVVW